MRSQFTRRRGLAMLTAALAAGGAAASVAGCGGPAPGSGGGSAGTIRLVTPVFEGPGGPELLRRLLAEFSDRHPDVRVEVDPTTYDKLNEKLATSIASGRPYDVMMLGAGWVPPFADRGVLAELDQSREELTETYEARVVEAGGYQGRVYALPVMLDARFGIYRKDIFAEAGLEKPPADFEQLRAYARELTIRNAEGELIRAGIDILSHDPRQLFETFLWAAGGQLFDEELTEPAFNGPEGVEALGLMTDLVRTEKAIDVGFTKVGDTNIPLLQGRAAMLVGHNSLWLEAEQQAPQLIEQDRLGTFVVTGTRPALFQGGTLAAASASSRNPEAANALVRFLASPRVSLAASRQRGNVPATKSSADSAYVRNNDFVRFAMDNLDVAYSEGGVPAWLEIREEFAGAVEAALLGQKTPKQALDDLAATAVQAMSRRG